MGTAFRNFVRRPNVILGAACFAGGVAAAKLGDVAWRKVGPQVRGWFSRRGAARQAA